MKIGSVTVCVVASLALTLTPTGAGAAWADTASPTRTADTASPTRTADTASPTRTADTASPTRRPDIAPQTRENILSAMHGEAYANASYRAYAQEADRTGQERLARLFRQTARVEYGEHFRELADLADFVRSNTENLRAAIDAETYEATVSYPAMAEQAESDGCPDVAAHFRELAEDEAGHAARFTEALRAIEDGEPASVPTGMPVPPVPVVAGPPQCAGQTYDNLYETLHGEAFANATYNVFAERARKTGEWRLAQLFENTGQQELEEHFSETAALAGLVGDNRENLETAIRGELFEAHVGYPSYARQASAAGDWRVARQFWELARDEAGHARSFAAALETLP